MSIISSFTPNSFFTRALSLAALTLVTPSVQPALAGAQDYRFEMAGEPAKSGKATLIKIRLVHVPDGKAVSDAIVIQTKFDMAPEGMAEMAPAKASATGEPGVYQVEAQPSMGGKWALTLSAKVQGEAETVRGTVVVPVPK
jgi:hypothetical protein